MHLLAAARASLVLLGLSGRFLLTLLLGLPFALLLHLLLALLFSLLFALLLHLLLALLLHLLPALLLLLLLHLLLAFLLGLLLTLFRFSLAFLFALLLGLLLALFRFSLALFFALSFALLFGFLLTAFALCFLLTFAFLLLRGLRTRMGRRPRGNHQSRDQNAANKKVSAAFSRHGAFTLLGIFSAGDSAETHNDHFAAAFFAASSWYRFMAICNLSLSGARVRARS